MKNKGTMKLWLSNDEQKFPIKIENRTDIGKMIMKLKNTGYTLMIARKVLLKIGPNHINLQGGLLI